MHVRLQAKDAVINLIAKPSKAPVKKKASWAGVKKTVKKKAPAKAQPPATKKKKTAKK